MKILYWILGFIVIIILLMASYNFLVLGQRDFGIVEVYTYCENGISGFNPPEMVERGFLTYYKGDMAIGACYGKVDEECSRVKQMAGSCTERGFSLHRIAPLRYLWLFISSLYQEPARPT